MFLLTCQCNLAVPFVPTNAWVETNAFASNLGIGGGSKRTISFWLYAENGNNEIEVHTASGGGVLIVLI